MSHPFRFLSLALPLGLALPLSLGQPIVAQDKAAPHAHPQGQNHTHSHGHSHDHPHHHSNDPKAQQATEAARSIYAGYFEDAAVADRPLADWEGRWQSVYPLLQDGTLDPVMQAKAKSGVKSAAEYRAYYETGYKTDLTEVEIQGDLVTFRRGPDSLSARYAADGHEILTYAKGNRGVRFIFRKISGDAAAPAVMQFSDHIIAPQKSDHFHLYLGDDRAQLLEEVTHWPTFYPADLSAEMIVEEMLAH